MDIALPANKKIYFASDFHLGAPNPAASREREKLLLQWLEQVEPDAQHIFLVGDIFDFWFEYKHVIPKGYTRILGKLAALSDKGIGISIFIGNHDMWMDGYFEEELNIPVYYEPQTYTIGTKRFYIGHGDGLGPGDHGYKMLKKVFRNPFCRWMFSAIHPAWGIALANYFSRKSRSATGQELEHFLGAENEWLAIYSKEVLQKEHFDYFIYGHRHLPLDIPLSNGSRYINLGDWLNYFSYAVFDGNTVDLKFFTEDGAKAARLGQQIRHPESHVK
ncbi:UDP-2,3-diacylglucosamine hydrolase [Chitinophaga ginsengisegetis]|uniref:UDP-2,3-diacylglucosamine hydrolase n=1 Tax=Chitinophaga ginsengisegetis TaxID=393003 RepID=A0A1T5NRJ9_9BACT|nr:UDP-2,3-diacylglucosamine diphosphatase [Chitinophaga ginsengisegetis]SKD03052.1 UDP-2,3-diacylglucosamine hydrolase [Chitinophaga ginsengisegetis]